MTAAPRLGSRRRCPICGKPAEPAFRAFCSRRCADVDLHRWLSGSYAIPAAEEDDPDEADLTPPPGLREPD